MRVLIVDDEALARRSVRRQLAKVLPEAIVEEAPDGCAALEIVEARPPQLIFLDVEMPELTGLDVLRQLPSPRAKVIFVTAYAHFAVRAFDANACDYLVKPFTAERFAEAVERALGQLDAEARLDALERSLADAGHRLDRLALRRGNVIDVVDVREVAAFVSEGHYTYVHAGKREYMTELSLQHLEEHLDPTLFVRSHRRALVNLTHVLRLRDANGLELDNGICVPVSRRNKSALVAKLRGFH